MSANGARKAVTYNKNSVRTKLSASAIAEQNINGQHPLIRGKKNFKQTSISSANIEEQNNFEGVIGNKL